MFVVSTVQNQTGVWFVFLPVAPLRSAAAVIPVLAAVTMAMGLLSSGLLCHLLCFHIYLSKSLTCLTCVPRRPLWLTRVSSVWNRLSTYEYIVRQRHRLDSRDLKTAAAKQSRRPSVVQVTNRSAERPNPPLRPDASAVPAGCELLRDAGLHQPPAGRPAGTGGHLCWFRSGPQVTSKPRAGVLGSKQRVCCVFELRECVL